MTSSFESKTYPLTNYEEQLMNRLIVNDEEKLKGYWYLLNNDIFFIKENMNYYFRVGFYGYYKDYKKYFSDLKTYDTFIHTIYSAHLSKKNSKHLSHPQPIAHPDEFNIVCEMLYLIGNVYLVEWMYNVFASDNVSEAFLGLPQLRKSAEGGNLQAKSALIQFMCTYLIKAKQNKKTPNPNIFNPNMIFQYIVDLEMSCWDMNLEPEVYVKKAEDTFPFAFGSYYEYLEMWEKMIPCYEKDTSPIGMIKLGEIYDPTINPNVNPDPIWQIEKSLFYYQEAYVLLIQQRIKKLKKLIKQIKPTIFRNQTLALGSELTQKECPCCLEGENYKNVFYCGHYTCVECFYCLQSTKCPICKEPLTYHVSESI